MSSVSAESINQILDVVNVALIAHTKWHEGLIRSLLCRTHMDESYIAKDAHHKCDFGCWFYAQNNSSFYGLPAASKIEESHKIMHDSARDMCLKTKANGITQAEDYDYFIRNLTCFKDELTSFRKRVLDTLESVSQK